MGIFLQSLYNLKVDDKTKKADASVEYRVTKDKETEPTLKFNVSPTRSAARRGNDPGKPNHAGIASARQVSNSAIAVTDKSAKQTITPTADFTVKPAPAVRRQPAGPAGEVKHSRL